MTELYLSLGSNLGDRKANIEAAIASLERYLAMLVSALSKIKEYKSWGFSGNDFLNCAVRFDIPDSGVDDALFLKSLLGEIKRVEAAQGRNLKVEMDAAGNRLYSNRPIDIDILFYGKTRLSTPLLEIPHKLIAQRDFVLEPLKEIATETLKQDFPSYFQ